MGYPMKMNYAFPRKTKYFNDKLMNCVRYLLCSMLPSDAPNTMMEVLGSPMFHCHVSP